MYLIIYDKIREQEDLSYIESSVLSKFIEFHENKRDCYPSNSWLADFFKVTPRTCTSIIAKLKSKGYIIVEYGQENGKETRIIKLTLKTITLVNRDKREIDEYKGKEMSKKKKRVSPNKKKKPKSATELFAEIDF